MKLGMLIPEFPTQTHIFFWREIQALRSLGVEVHLLSTRRPTEACPHPFALGAAAETHYLYPPDLAAAASLTLRPVDLSRALRYVASLGGLRRLPAAALIPSAADLARHACRVGLDHIHVHSCAAAAHVAALARSLGGPPYSLHLHGDLPVYGADHRQKSRMASFVAAAARPIQQQLIEQVRLPPERTCTLLMGVDTDRFTSSGSASAEGGPFRIVTVARLNLAKGHRYAFEAVSAALAHGVDLQYRVIGSGPHQANIEADMRRLGLQDRVTLLGSLGEDAVRDELRRAHVFVLPTSGIGEASPVAVMEAMASGVPVIASRVGGTPDMIADGVEGFLVPPMDADAIAAAVVRLWREPEVRRAMGLASRRRAVEQFDSRARARRLLETIERCVCPAAPRWRDR